MILKIYLNRPYSKLCHLILYTLVAYDLELNNGVLDWEGFDYTYHELYSKYYDSCIAELKRDNRTRRATLPIAGDKSYNSPHPPCLQTILIKIKDGKLHTTSVFRSNDGVKAIVMNLFGIARLAHRVAKDVGVEVGGLTHIADSYHAYEKDWAELEGYCKMFETRNDEDLYYTYDEYLEAYDEYADEFIEECERRRLEKESK